MSTEFDPGPGWREVDYAPMDGEEEYLVHTPVDDTKVTYWARVPPVPPLPTEPGYYLGQQRGLGPIVVELLASPGVTGCQWVDAGDRNYLDPEAVAALGPLVRLEPRAATAKAVLAEAERYFDGAWIIGHERLFSYDHQRALFERLRSKFGVSDV